MSNKLYFSGHETFYCRNFWLKKGYDHLSEQKKFEGSAVVDLGVGKNMVASIRYWLKAFGLTDEQDVPHEIAQKIFGKRGMDPYCEDIGTIWLLHFLLVTHKRASIYGVVFNDFRKQRVEFTREHLLQFLEQYCLRNGVPPNKNTLKKDITVFLGNYTVPQRSTSIEDDFSGLLHELNLVHTLERSGGWYRIENASREELPYQIVLFCILSTLSGQSISFNELLNNPDSVGSVFALTSNGLMEKIQGILDEYPEDIVFTDDGGVKLLQFKNKLDSWDVLSKYYGS